MSPADAPSPPQAPPPTRTADRVHRWTATALLAIMGVELVIVVLNGQWMTAFLVAVIMGITLAPILLRAQLPVHIPPEFQVLAIAFVFASLFLGEVRSFYERLWWWDIALHAGSGLLLGLLGFLLVYALNENERVDLHMRPRFVALFAFCFALAAGALWEVFEFGMDRFFGTRMQKPMLGDPSGLTDTMWDLIVDALGALVISSLGWWHMHMKRRSFIDAWIQRFVDGNPRLFPR
jgi:uncharacterized membrane protein YjdF